MQTSQADRVFSGSIPDMYDRYMVPLIFEPYAGDIAARIARRQPGRVLEIAAGTGVVTRRLAAILQRDAGIVATDLNQPMIDHAAATIAGRPIEWRQADAMQLPFPDHEFDVVVCQFGAMFFPDKPKAFAEARRVLRAGGLFVFNVWDRIEENAFADVVTQALAEYFPDDPPRFMARVPHGYHDVGAIVDDLAQGGFRQPPMTETLAFQSRASSARIAATAYCEGTPLRAEIEKRDPSALSAATDFVESVLIRKFGAGAVEGKIQAHVVAASA